MRMVVVCIVCVCIVVAVAWLHGGCVDNRIVVCSDGVVSGVVAVVG